MPPTVSINDDERQRFIQEANAAAAINHPNVCVIHDIYATEDQQFIVMEFVDGKTLREIAANAPLSTDHAIQYAIQIGEALQPAHEQRLIHRDIKSENIMVMSKNQIKVMDFGLAKLKGALKLTKSSSTLGTLNYISPEQISGSTVDAGSDIFPLAWCCSKCLPAACPSAANTMGPSCMPS